MTDNSLLEGLNLDDYQEPQVFEAGAEVQVRVIDAQPVEGTSDKGPWAALELVLAPINYQDVYPEITNPKLIYHRIFLPVAGASAQAINAAKGKIKRIYAAIGSYPTGGVPKCEDFHGQMFFVQLAINTKGEEPKNEIRKFLTAAA